MKAFLADNTWIIWWAVIMIVVLRWFHLMASISEHEEEEPEYPAANPPMAGLSSGPAGSMAH
jgi:hypothetical protein